MHVQVCKYCMEEEGGKEKRGKEEDVRDEGDSEACERSRGDVCE